MNVSKRFHGNNPFVLSAAVNVSAFKGRHRELKEIYNALSSQTSQSCSVIGDNYIGKTSFLRYLADRNGALADKELSGQSIIFLYIDANPYSNQDNGDRTSVQFWWDMYSVLQAQLNMKEEQVENQFPPRIGLQENPADVASKLKDQLKDKLEDILKQQKCRIIFVIDNFEGVVSLPIHNSAWLRSLNRYCSYIVSCRYPLQLLYHPGSWGINSPIWHDFTKAVYLSLLHEDEVTEFIFQEKDLQGFWQKEDVLFIRKAAGRHPAFLRIACMYLYNLRKISRRPLNDKDKELVEFNLYRDASVICNQLWHGLADPELMGISRKPGYEGTPQILSLYQKSLLKVAQKQCPDTRILLELEQRGLVEYIEEEDKWQIFSKTMQQFLLNLAQVQGWTDFHLAQSTWTSQSQSAVVESVLQPVTVPQEDEERQEEEQPLKSVGMPAFTYLEGEVYHYLQAHIDTVCSKNDIKEAVWKKKQPTDSTLQKLIERIREKIEHDPDNPRYLIAVRGQGYILRSGQ